VDSDIVLWNWLNGEFAAPLHLQAINADILDIVVVPVVGVAADYACFVKEEASIAAVEPEQRYQVEQIDVPVNNHLLPRGAVEALYFARILLVATREFEELLADRRLLVHAEH
jgi:hypothetical protein